MNDPRMLTRLASGHRGVLAAKVRGFGSNLLKCSREQIGTKRAYLRPATFNFAPGAWRHI